MKKIQFAVFSAFLFLTSAFLYAAEAKAMLTDEELDYAEIANTIQKAGSPYLNGDYAIFTSETNARHIGIAFDFEDFKTIHSFKIKKFTDMDYKESGSLYFYILKLPRNILEINYRLIVDGLWTLDPLNSSTVFSRETKLTLSHFNAYREIPKTTEKISPGKVRFVYTGKTGQKIRIGGSFTNWDSWIYQMNEVSPGVYQFELSLPPGKYEYAFYSGINSFPDPGNPTKCYTPDGKTASLIEVN
ncbi:glycogen-binding domain-containing protein [Treponema sp.]|uniref:glycogen-binding domain-containing protein n=1 Tax=Treponema sp. TaxID=166 RepID=UPI003EFD2C05